MAVIAPPHAAAPPVSVEPISPRRRAWTRAEFEHLIDAGAFGPDERLELIDGDLVCVPLLSPAGATSISLTSRVLHGLFAKRGDVRTRMPLALGEADRPEPNLAVVAGGPRDYLASHPKAALLVVEISDTTLAFDRTFKAGQYARAGIAELWIVNLRDRVLEVFRQPAPMADQPLGHHYRSVTRHTDEETVAPLAAPDAAVGVADLLP